MNTILYTKENSTVNRLLSDVNNLMPEELDIFSKFFFKLYLSRNTNILNADVSLLLKTINEIVNPQLLQEQKKLAKKIKNRTITEQELATLHNLNDKIEKLNVERIRCIGEIAAITDSTPADVIKKYRLAPQRDE